MADISSPANSMAAWSSGTPGITGPGHFRKEARVVAHRRMTAEDPRFLATKKHFGRRILVESTTH
jgi:hypothetical protein